MVSKRSSEFRNIFWGTQRDSNKLSQTFWGSKPLSQWVPQGSLQGISRISEDHLIDSVRLSICARSSWQPHETWSLLRVPIGKPSLQFSYETRHGKMCVDLKDTFVFFTNLQCVCWTHCVLNFGECAQHDYTRLVLCVHTAMHWTRSPDAHLKLNARTCWLRRLGLKLDLLAIRGFFQCRKRTVPLCWPKMSNVDRHLML